MSDKFPPLRSAQWFGSADKNGFMYFAYFILMPFYTRLEKTKPVPERVTG